MASWVSGNQGRRRSLCSTTRRDTYTSRSIPMYINQADTQIITTTAPFTHRRQASCFELTQAHDIFMQPVTVIWVICC